MSYKRCDGGVLVALPSHRRNEVDAKMKAFIYKMEETKTQIQKRKILRNVIRCKHCLIEIESSAIHDLKYCDCGKVGVDGGQEYIGRSG